MVQHRRTHSQQLSCYCDSQGSSGCATYRSYHQLVRGVDIGLYEYRIVLRSTLLVFARAYCLIVVVALFADDESLIDSNQVHTWYILIIFALFLLLILWFCCCCSCC